MRTGRGVVRATSPPDGLTVSETDRRGAIGQADDVVLRVSGDAVDDGARPAAEPASPSSPEVEVDAR